MKVFQAVENRNLSFSDLIYIEQFLIMKAKKKNISISSKTISTDHVVFLELKLSVFNLVPYGRPMPRIKDWRIYVCQWAGSYSLLASIGKLSLFVFTLPVSKSLPRKIVMSF